MQTYKKYGYLTGLLVALFFVLTACAAPGLAGSPPTPAQTLQKSAQAMSKLKTVHFALSQTTLTVQSGSSTTNGISFNVSGQGDVASPDGVSLSLALGQNPLISVVSLNGTAYVQVMGGTWYSTSTSQLKDSLQKLLAQNPTKGVGQVMTILQNAKLTDHGQVSLDGTSLDHITATLDQQTLQELNTQLGGLLPANEQGTQNSITQATMDFWIDQSTGYVHQLTLDITAQVDGGALQQYTHLNLGKAAPLTVELKSQINFSKFNQPVTIYAPAKSVPATY